MVFLGVSGMFFAVTELPLAIAMTLTLTTPVFVMILGHFSINEKIQLRQLGPAILTLIGIALILDLRIEETIDTSVPLIPAVVGLMGSVLTALAFLSMRSALQLVSANVVVFWFSLANLIGAGIISFRSLSLPNENNIYFLIAICILGLMSDISKTTAYKYAVAWFVSLVSLTSVAFSIFWGWSVFGEHI